MALDFQSARTLSLAGGGRGGALLEDTTTLNPSMLGFYPISSISGTLDWIKPGNGTRMFHVGVIDGRNEYVAAGISFTRNQEVDVFHLALAKQALPWLSFGVHAKRFTTRQEQLPPLVKSITGYDYGVSASVATPKDMLAWPVQVGITADNLIHTAGYEQYVGPKQYAIGAKTNIKDILLLYADFVEGVFSGKGALPAYSGGAEISLGNDFYIRGGGFGFRDKGWGAGGGWVGPKVGLNYGYQKQTLEISNFQHAVTMDIYM